MVVYAGLPPPIPLWQEERDKKNKFVYWLRSNGFMVVTKDGAPAEEGHYKANVDVMMAIDALELSVEMQPDVVILVTGDADFAYRHQNAPARDPRRSRFGLSESRQCVEVGRQCRDRSSPLFRTFELMPAPDVPRHPDDPQRRQSGDNSS